MRNRVRVVTLALAPGRRLIGGWRAAISQRRLTRGQIVESMIETTLAGFLFMIVVATALVAFTPRPAESAAEIRSTTPVDASWVVVTTVQRWTIDHFGFLLAPPPERHARQ